MVSIMFPLWGAYFPLTQYEIYNFTSTDWCHRAAREKNLAFHNLANAIKRWANSWVGSLPNLVREDLIANP